jgi:hypothetical protein
MKVRMTTIAAGPKGLVDADQVVELPDAKAGELIETLHAVPAGPDDKVTARWPHGVELSHPKKAAK